MKGLSHQILVLPRAAFMLLESLPTDSGSRAKFLWDNCIENTCVLWWWVCIFGFARLGRHFLELSTSLGPFARLQVLTVETAPHIKLFPTQTLCLTVNNDCSLLQLMLLYIYIYICCLCCYYCCCCCCCCCCWPELDFHWFSVQFLWETDHFGARADHKAL